MLRWSIGRRLLHCPVVEVSKFTPGKDMKFLLSLSPKVKLVLSFLVVSCILSGVSLMALYKMSQMNQTIHGMYDNQLLPIDALGQTRSLVLEICKQTQAEVLTSDGTKPSLSPAEFQKLFTNTYEEIVVPQATTPEELAMTVKIKADFQKMLKEVETAAKLPPTTDREVRQASVGTVLETSNQLLVSLDEEIAFNRNLAENGLKDSQRAYTNATWLVYSLVLAGTSLGIAIGWCIASWISRVLLNVEQLSKEVQQRADRERLDAQEQQRKVANVLQLVNEVAQGNFEIKFPDLGRDSIGQVASALEATVDAIRDSLTQVRDVSETVSTASEQLSSTSREIANGAQVQASNLEETASSLEEITSTIKQNSDNAQQARQLASGAREVAERGGSVVSDAVSAMGEINASSKRIADIITTIDEIAFQTNLLALNAAVEAARAGEQGRGFAVVAAEVRNLAQRSASAAKEIKNLIQDSVNKVQNGTELVNKSGATLNEIVTSVKRVSDIVAEIAAASKEQLSGVEQVNKAMSQMDRVTQGNAAQTEEMSGTSVMLLKHARTCQKMSAGSVWASEMQPRAYINLPAKMNRIRLPYWSWICQQLHPQTCWSFRSDKNFVTKFFCHQVFCPVNCSLRESALAAS